MAWEYDLGQLKTFVRQSGLFDQAAQVMGDFILRASTVKPPELYLTVVLTVQCSTEQHICLKLPEYAGKILTSQSSGDQLQLPELPEWLEALKQCQAGNTIFFDGSAGNGSLDSALLVIDKDSGCYLQRQWSLESSIVKNLLDRANTFLNLPELPAGYLHNLISFFPTAAQHPTVDYQQLAAATALRRKLLVLSGGPGTGKTTVAAAILAVKLEQNPDLRIKLAAPTAKAAVRLLQSLKNNVEKLSSPENIKEKLRNLESSTLHSLLGVRHGSHEFFYNSTNYLNCDILLIDECSMVSQHHMARTLEALSPDTTLILLGDRHQLASVEAGAVMADICDSAEPNRLDRATAELFRSQTTWQIPAADENMLKKAPLTGALVELTENHRFANNARILGETAAIIRNLTPEDDIPAIAAEIAGKSGEEFEFNDIPAKNLKSFLEKKFSVKRLESGETFADLPRLAASGNADDRQKAFALMDKIKILSPAYEGPRGINNLNQLAMNILNLSNMYEPGMILLVKRNDYRIELVNGDIGLVGRDENGNIKVFFTDKVHPYDTADLPEHEAVFAMTVHKSQGSGFGEVIFVMPEKCTDLMTREMVYTAMTRAENKLSCIGSKEILAEALSKVTVRMSNLANKLKNLEFSVSIRT